MVCVLWLIICVIFILVFIVFKCWIGSLDSVVTLRLGYGLDGNRSLIDDRVIDYWQGQRFFSSKCRDWFWSPLSLLFGLYWGFLFIVKPLSHQWKRRESECETFYSSVFQRILNFVFCSCMLFYKKNVENVIILEEYDHCVWMLFIRHTCATYTIPATAVVEVLS